jgi:hypothetical protein
MSKWLSVIALYVGYLIALIFDHNLRQQLIWLLMTKSV